MSARGAIVSRAVCVAIVAFDLAFMAPAWLSLRVWWYLPVEHRWMFVVKPSEIAMDWYGRSLLAVAAAALGYVFAQLPKATPKDSSLALWTGWATIATAMALALQVFQLVTRHLVPAPLPDWYVPR